jgi:hypothetical protein
MVGHKLSFFTSHSLKARDQKDQNDQFQLFMKKEEDNEGKKNVRESSCFWKVQQYISK